MPGAVDERISGVTWTAGSPDPGATRRQNFAQIT